MFTIQDGDQNIIGLNWLYYYKDKSVALLTNMYTMLSIINGVWSTVYGIIICQNSKSNYEKLKLIDWQN